MSLVGGPIAMAVCLFDYVASEEDELDLVKDEVLEVLVKHEDGWLTAKTQGGKMGLIPSNYVFLEMKTAKTKAAAYLPPGWESAIDSDSGERYYYNKATGQVQWDSPDGINSRTSIGTKSNGKAGAGNSSATAPTGDLIEFKRLREEADAKLAALR